MKKLMIAAAIVCAAAYAQAANIDWSVKSGWTVETSVDEDPSNLDGLKAYAFDANVYSTTAFIKALGTDGDLSYLDNAMGYTTIDGGEIKMISKDSPSFDKITTVAGVTDPENSYASAYFVIMNSDNTKYYLYDDFDPILAAQTVVAAGASFELMDDLVTGSISGWADVAPEPTSGLLLLIGVAGLALKRKRA